MATKQQLIARWEAPEGQQVLEALYQAFASSTTLEQLRIIVSALPYVDEVAPNLDLRGLHSRKVPIVRHLDLPGVRLDYSSISGNFSGGNWHSAVFDGANVTQLYFVLDLTQASFAKANARGTRFSRSILDGASFREARLIGAHLRNTSCQRVDFSRADLRDAWCAESDFRGANLSGANLKGAGLGSILFDENTKIQGADFTGTSMSKDFKAFVVEHGGQAKPEDDSETERAKIEATIALVEARVKAGQIEPSQVATLLATLNTIQRRLIDDPHYDSTPLVESLPEQEKKLLYGAYDEGSREYIHFM